MRSMIYKTLPLALTLTFIMASFAGAQSAMIQGIVKDEAGKPIRGAMVSATKGDHLVARFSQPDGRYMLKLDPGMYEMRVRAYGYAEQTRKKSTTSKVAANFKMAERYDLNSLTSSDIQQLLPDTQETRVMASECIRCHAFTQLAKGGSMTKAVWAEFMPKMTHGRFWDNPYGAGEFKGSGSDVVDYKDRQDALSTALEKYFGPKSPYFSPDVPLPMKEQIKHPPIPDLALKVTIHEYEIPTKDVGAHSIMADSEGNAWYSEIQAKGNKVGKFDFKTKKFTQYNLPIPESRPHTGVIGKDGLVWMPLTARKIKPKLASIDPKTGKIEMYEFPGNPWRPHTTAIDPDGNVWLSGTNDLVKFDVTTHQFKMFKLPTPKGTDYPENTWQGWHNLPGGPKLPIDQTTYDLKSDSKGIIWCSIQSIGLLIRFDPKTEQTKVFTPPGTVSIKGVQVDKDDNIWFAEFWGSMIGKFDQKTESFTMYKPPTPFAMPYGITADWKTGRIWYADVNGNFITRFDPKTGQFDEIPIPSSQASARFPGIDPKSGRVWFTEALNDKIGYIELDRDKK